MTGLSITMVVQAPSKLIAIFVGKPTKHADAVHHSTSFMDISKPPNKWTLVCLLLRSSANLQFTWLLTVMSTNGVENEDWSGHSDCLYKKKALDDNLSHCYLVGRVYASVCWIISQCNAGDTCHQSLSIIHGNCFLWEPRFRNVTPSHLITTPTNAPLLCWRSHGSRYSKHEGWAHPKWVGKIPGAF